MLKWSIFILFVFNFCSKIDSEGLVVNVTDSSPDKYSQEKWIYFKKTGYYYKLFNISTTWHYAEEICQSVNSHLISLHSLDEIKFATDLASPFSTNQCLYRAQTWIGSFTTDLKKHWSWTDGTVYNYTLWGPHGTPVNPVGQNCGDIWTGVTCLGTRHNVLYSHACSFAMSNFICKKFA